MKNDKGSVCLFFFSSLEGKFDIFFKKCLNWALKSPIYQNNFKKSQCLHHVLINNVTQLIQLDKSYRDYKTHVPYADFLNYRTALGAFEKLRKAAVCFVFSVCLSVCPLVYLSVRMEQLGSHWTDFHGV